MTRRKHHKSHQDYESWKSSFHGPPEDEQYDYYGSPNPQKLYRSKSERVIGGVCGGIAERYGWEPVLLRIAVVLSFFLFAGPLIIIAYIIAWMVIPDRPRHARELSPDEERFWRGVSDRPSVTFSNLRYKFMDLEDRLQRMERSVVSDEWRLRKEFRDLERG